MRSRRSTLALSVVVSLGLIAILAFWADFDFPDVKRFDPVWLAAVLIAVIFMIVGRGLSLHAQAGGKVHEIGSPWFRLAARHQAVFSIFPSGVGDVGFPMLAKQLLGLAPGDALGILARIRLRDALLVAIMGLTGTVLIGVSGWLSSAALIPAILLLWYVDEIAQLILKLAATVPHQRLAVWLTAAAQSELPSTAEKVERTISAALVWGATICAVMAAFRAIGFPIGLGEALLFIAIVNAFGLVALSIAGLGVSEAGGAIALVLAGHDIQNAASLALVVRPILLIVILFACLLVDGTLGLIRLRAASRR